MTAREIITALQGRWHGSYGTARCPAHEDHKPSLSVSESNGVVLVKCHAECDQQAVIDALKKRSLWHGQDDFPRAKPLMRKAEPRTAENPNRNAALSIWQNARPAGNTPVETYLRSRGITLDIPASIRYAPDLKHGPTGLLMPAMVCAVQGPDRAITGIHRTYLVSDGSRKAPISQGKMMLGKCATGAVRLAAAGESLILAEGIETALSVMQAIDKPTWACLSTSGLKTVALPQEVREVVIAADGDEPGEKAAQEAAQRFLAEGRRVKIARPPKGMDFNDVLMLPENVTPIDSRRQHHG